jgi:hypothetical protein
MTKLTKPTSSGSILRKIVAAFVFTVIAIFLAYTITRYAFQDMLDTVEDLSAPNEKLSALHHVFEEITKLDHLHRAEAIKNPDKPFKDFLNQSKISLAMIDSLAMLNWHPDQQARIDSMKDILRKRDELFFAYLKMKSNLLRNKSLTKRIDKNWKSIPASSAPKRKPRPLTFATQLNNEKTTVHFSAGYSIRKRSALPKIPCESGCRKN